MDSLNVHSLFNVQTDQVLNRASDLGYRCHQDAAGKGQIRPNPQKASWHLQQVEDRWVLAVDHIAQISFHPQEAIAFLERHQWVATPARTACKVRQSLQMMHSSI